MESNALFSPQVAASQENQSQASVLKLWVYLIRAKLGKKNVEAETFRRD